MSYGMMLVALLPESLLREARSLSGEVRRILRESEDELVALVLGFLGSEITPQSTMQFETALQHVVRETARRICELIYNRLEPDSPADLPEALTVSGDTHVPATEKTPHADVLTLFGRITLHRFVWRQPDHRGSGVCPLEDALGLIRGCTPALAERAAWLGAQAGATQRLVIDRLRRDHNLRIGTGRLRALWDELAGRLEPFRREQQARRVVELLQQAEASKGRCRPVLAAGRDGVTICEQPHGFFEVATCATLTVYDRRGQRLGTVYLGFAPQLGQDTMTQELKALLQAVLALWEGRLPRLCYVSDAGSHEETFYTRYLCRMRHPVTKERLKWQRIVDFYHASQRLGTLASCLAISESRARAWQRRMRKVLLQQNGVKRVLMSAAAMRKEHGLKPGGRTEEFETAVNYLRKRTRWMRYDEYRRRHLPIGSGVTEAGCKTLFTQRAKLSGMRWKKQGLQVILTLRMLVLSDVWDATWSAHLSSPPEQQLRFSTAA